MYALDQLDANLEVEGNLSFFLLLFELLRFVLHRADSLSKQLLVL